MERDQILSVFECSDSDGVYFVEWESFWGGDATYRCVQLGPSLAVRIAINDLGFGDKKQKESKRLKSV